MDQRFSASSNVVELETEKENRRLGAIFLALGIAATCAVWYLGPRWRAFSGGRIIAITLCGAVLFLAGIANVISPPKTELRSAENRKRAQLLGIAGIVLGGIEIYFYNEIHGLW